MSLKYCFRFCFCCRIFSNNRPIIIHTNLPSIIAEGNKQADTFTYPIVTSPELNWEGVFICHCRWIHWNSGFFFGSSNPRPSGTMTEGDEAVEVTKKTANLQLAHHEVVNTLWLAHHEEVVNTPWLAHPAPSWL